MSELHVVHKGTSRRTVVFIHGLEGDAQKTWVAPSGFSWPSWVAAQTGWNVISVGYAATAAGWRPDMSISDRANQLLAVLKTEPGVADGSIALVTHSLGGLVAKQMTMLAEGNRREHAWFLDKLVGIVFVATPHTGSDLASYVSALGVLVGGGSALRDLVKDASPLRDLNRWFRDHVEELAIRVLVFFEKQSMKIGPLRTGMVVEPGSADPGIKGVEVLGLDADHSTAAKPDSPTCTQVRCTQQFLQDIFALDTYLQKLPRQAGAVCYRVGPDGEPEFLLVKTDRGRWTFPKGNIEASRGESIRQAAAREAAEEAGALGDVAEHPLHTYLHLKLKKRSKALDPKTRKEFAVTVYLLRVRQQREPQEEGREPTWFTASEAAARLQEEREPHYADEIVRALDKACSAIASIRPAADGAAAEHARE
jgi:8-oxo-dGTP pyrophosphatase MutT (NUDIX family)/pimeloyl-ACP methyl ester carboxylesterase